MTWLFSRAFALAYALVFMFVLVLAVATSASAQTIDIGAAFGSTLQPIINSLFAALIAIGIGWLAYYLKSKFGIEIDAGNRDALTAFLQRQAASLVADGAVKLQGVQVSVGNAALAAAANAAIQHIPDALAYFGLTTDKIAAMIIDFIPHVPAVAQAQAVALTSSAAPAAATTTPSPSGA